MRELLAVLDAAFHVSATFTFAWFMVASPHAVVRGALRLRGETDV